MSRQTISGLALLGFLLLPQARAWLESSMTGQMLVQIPLLITAGYWLGNALLRKSPAVHEYLGGISGLLLAVFTVTFWSLPRSLDASLTTQGMEIAKFVTLPFLAGLPLGVGWARLGFVAKAFTWTNLLSMIFLMAWLYAETPVRVCNRYLINQQQMTGWILFGVGVAIVLYHFGMAIGNAFSDDSENTALHHAETKLEG